MVLKPLNRLGVALQNLHDPTDSGGSEGCGTNFSALGTGTA